MKPCPAGTSPAATKKSAQACNLTTPCRAIPRSAWASCIGATACRATPFQNDSRLSDKAGWHLFRPIGQSGEAGQHRAAYRLGTQETAEIMNMVKPKLTQAQRNIMKWLGQGWITEPVHGSTVMVNGQRICSIATLKALERAGYVESDANHCWKVTAAGCCITGLLCL